MLGKRASPVRREAVRKGPILAPRWRPTLRHVRCGGRPRETGRAESRHRALGRSHSYRLSPYEEPVTGLDAIKRMWDGERNGPDQVFTLATDIVAIDGPTAVVRAEVRYGNPVRQEYRDLWVLRLRDDGLCRWFEEWPYWPGRAHSARDDSS